MLDRAWAAGVQGILVPAIGPGAWDPLLELPGREPRLHTCDHRTQVNGSVGFVTSVFGMNAAGVVVRRIAHGR